MHYIYDENETNLTKEWIKQSIGELVERDHELLNPEKIQTDYIIEKAEEKNRQIHETAINHRLAVYLEKNIKMVNIEGYHVDIEYNRFMNFEKLVKSLETNNPIEVRPDILVHTRTNMQFDVPHFLVVEAKKRKHNDKDRNHIKDIMADYIYKYKYGLLVSYYRDPDNVECELLELNDHQFISHEFKVPNNII